MLYMSWLTAGIVCHAVCLLIFLLYGSPGGYKREAYVTLLYDEPFINATRVLFHSLRRTRTEKEFLVLVADLRGNETLSATSLRQLRNLGCRVKHVRLIENPWMNVSQSLIRSVLQYQFTKLRVWEQTEYTKLVYLDSDMLVLRNIDTLFNYSEMSAADDYGFQASAYAEFNGGLLVVEPSTAQLRKMRESWPKMPQATSMEQSFMNRYFKEWTRLPYIFNTPANVFLRNPKMWSRAIRVIHYTFSKPWEPRTSQFYLHGLDPVYQLWHNAFDELLRWEAAPR